MSKVYKNHRKARKHSSPVKNANIPNTVMAYKGPIRLKSTQNATSETYVINLSYTVDLSSSAAGVINAVYGSDPSGSAEYASVAALWHEYRVMGMSVSYLPINRYNYSNTATNVVALFDTATSSALTGYDEAWAHSSAVPHMLTDPFSLKFRSSGDPMMSWTPTTSPGSSFWFKAYGNGCSLTSTYGKLYFQLLVQFKNRA